MSSIDNQEIDQAALLTDFALDELQLQDQPFVASTDGESYLDSIAEAQLDDIKQALISGDDLLLILGPEGSGKSTLLSQLGTNSGQRIQCFSVRGSERFSTSNLFAGMLEAFKKEPPNDLKLMLDDLIPALQGMADHNTLGAVVLDDANLIPEAELTKLLSGMLYINSSDETLLRVTLAAPTEFEERIPELLPEGADLPYSSLAIDAFDKDRSAAYLHYRFQKAGGGDALPFTDEELATLNAEAGGRPGHLHVVAAQHLNSRDENYVPELPPELSEGKKKAAGAGFFAKIGGTKLLAGALALLMIFAGLFMLKPDTNNVPDDRYKVVESKKIESDKEENAIRLLEEQKLAEQQAEQQEQEKLSAAASTNSNSSTTESTQASENDTAATGAAAKAEAQLQAKLEREAAEKAELAKKQAEEAEKLAQAKAAEEKAAREKAEQAELAKQQAAAAKAEEEKLAKEKAEKEAAEKAQTEQTLANVNNLESPNWILVQNPSLFTVQMIADTKRQSVETFLSRANLDGPNSIFSFDRDGVTWHALVHGLYGSIEEARKDIEKMPATARNNQPWIRAVGRIQNALKEQN